MFDTGRGFAYDSPELAAMMTVWLGSGRANALSGRYVHVTWDIEQMERCASVVGEKLMGKERFIEGGFAIDGKVLGEWDVSKHKAWGKIQMG
jgi:hypothetical protein